ncbi:hypothetical protein [Lentisalinibacter salinarum]|uniref:hypothetical protein n=1 Tax=Lentisalinibacter salinarum TaxID=2992239 RepID=UPI00386891FF
MSANLVKLYRLSRGLTEATLNFDAYQFYVAELEALNGRIERGVVSLHAGSIDFEMPHPLEESQANDLILSIRALSPGILPARLRIPGSRVNYWNSVTIKFRKHGKDERGSFYSGTATRGNCLGMTFNSVKVYERTLHQFAEALERIYSN